MMQQEVSIVIALCTLFLSACGAPIATDIPVSPTQIPTIAPSLTAQSTGTQASVSLEFIALGSYHVGVKRNIAYDDPARNARKISITIWYPALQPEGSSSGDADADAMPDLSNAPYPLILSSSKVGFIFAPHLVSYGFVYVGINGQDSSHHWGKWITDYPLDIVFVLNQIASHSLLGLEGMIDTDHAGAMGYSFDGYTSLALSGARADPVFYLAQCENAAGMNSAPPAWWIDYICNPTGGWDAVVGNAGSIITAGDDGLWKAMTDERIRAVMPMAPEGAWLFGERGLAAADRPILIIGATADEINIYDLEAAYIFENLNPQHRTMISFVDQGHMMIYDDDQVARMKHFAVAFFGFHLQGQDEYRRYYSQDFIAHFEELFWGVYEE